MCSGVKECKGEGRIITMDKLMILGGFPQMVDIVLTAKNMGIFTIVVDMNENSPAKKVADKAFNISTDKVNDLIELCRTEKITGVFTGFEDFNIHIAQKICEALNLPFYASKEQLECVTNKMFFKNVCREYSVPVIEQYTFEEAITCAEYPYIVKPSDSYGSRGITVCWNESELLVGYNNAVNSSRTKSPIIEKFINSDYGSELFYTIVNGKIFLTATADRYTVKLDDSSVPLPVAEVFPSKHNEKLKNKLDSNIRQLIKGLKIENGLVLIQTLYDENNFYVYEMAYRLTGEEHYKLVAKQQGIDLSRMMINLATGKDINEFDTDKISNKYFSYPSVNLALVLKEGKIKSIKGMDIVRDLKEVVSYNVTHFEDDILDSRGDYSRIFARINIVAQDYEKLYETVTEILKNVVVESYDNVDMICKQSGFFERLLKKDL